MTHKIICYGDSNTYGYDAKGYISGRLPKDTRWTGILDSLPDYEIVNCGENGREIPTDRWELSSLDTVLQREAPFDLLTVMLGTNDLLTMFRSGMPRIAARMEQFLTYILKNPALEGRADRILLIAPPPTHLSLFGQDGERYDRISAEFGGAYAQLARETGVHFANAGRWGIELGSDGVHFTEKGHKPFARHMQTVLKDIFTAPLF